MRQADKMFAAGMAVALSPAFAVALVAGVTATKGPPPNPDANWSLMAVNTYPGTGEIEEMDFDLTLEDCVAEKAEVRKYWGTNIQFYCEEK